ncbi:MAG: hypothetical protein ACHQAX_01380 [Gammaproteobacteria bacterium]
MNAKSLSQTNPHIRDPRKRSELFRKIVIDSSAVESIDPLRLEKKLPLMPDNINQG